MLRKITYLASLFFVSMICPSISFAQTGVLISGAAGTADPSAMLEINSTNRGLLLPRVNLVGLTNASSPISGPATGLLVYNLGGGGVPAVGLYYWTGTSWTQLTSGGFSGSGTTGRITKWTASNALGDSQLFESGSNVGIGLTNPGARLTIRNGATDPGATDDGKVLFVTGGFAAGSSYDGGIEFRHDNLTQGIGFGYNTIYAAGTNTDQELNLLAKGSGRVISLSGMTVNGGLLVSGTASTLYGTNARIYANNDNVAGGGIMIADDGGFADYNDGFVTFVGSTGLKIAGSSSGASNGVLRINGLSGSGDGLVYADNNGTLVKSTGTCPGGWTTFNNTYTTLCIIANGTGRNWPNSATYCHSVGGRICSKEQYTIACKNGYAGVTNYWLKDFNADDNHAIVNNGSTASCDNPDGTAGYGDIRGVMCCIERTRF